MKIKRCGFLGFIFLLAFGFCVPQSRAAATNKTTTATPPARLPLWQVTGGKSPVYLLGSIHVLKEENYPLPRAMDVAFSNASVVVLEVDLADMESPDATMNALTKTMLPDGKSLEDELSPTTYSNLMAHIRDAGLPEMMFEHMKPAFAAVSVIGLQLQKMGFDPEKGIDKHYYQLARDQDKTVKGLETVDFQISLFTDFTKEEGELAVKSMLKDTDDLKKTFRDLLKAWSTGDAVALHKYLNETQQEAPAIFKRLITDRNHNWIPQIEALTNGDKPAIVIVGAGHLVGPEGVVELLRKKGLKVTQQ